MCFSPLHIKNPRIMYRDGLDKIALTVPCGRCAECRQRKADDWYVRTAYEWLKFTTKLHGVVYFPTLTENPEHQQYFDNSSIEFDALDKELGLKRPIVRYQCHDKKRVIAFFKSLRQWMSKPVNDIPKGLYIGITEGIKYFLASEYGTDKHLPHYHILNFLPKEVDFKAYHHVLQLSWSQRVSYKDLPKDFLAILQTYKDIPHVLFREKQYHIVYSETLQKGNYNYIILPPRKNQKKFQVFHRYGFVGWSKDLQTHQLRPRLESVAGCRYVSEYITKQDGFEKQNGVAEVRDYLRQIPRPYVGRYKKIVDSYKNSLPFLLASNGYGDELISQFTDVESDIQAYKRFVNNKVYVDGDIRQYPMPQYVINRLFYQNRHYDNLQDYRQLSEIGLYVCYARAWQRVDDYSRRVNFYLKSDIVQDIPKELFDKFPCRNIQGQHLDFWSILDQCRSTVDNVGSRNISLYYYFLQDVTDSYIKDGLGYNLDNAFGYNYLEDCVSDMLYYNVATFNDFSPRISPKDMSHFDFFCHRSRTFNQYHCFTGFDNCTFLVSYIQKVLRKHLSTLDKKSSEYNLIIKKLNYGIYGL